MIRPELALIPAFAVVVALFTIGCDKNNVSSPAGPAEADPSSLSDPSIVPAVVTTVPAAGASGPFRVYNAGPGNNEPHFVVQFNKYINVASIRESTITCQGFPFPVRVIVRDMYYYGPGFAAAPQEAASPFRNLIEFAIVRGDYWNSVPYELGAMYTVTIGTSIEDINGNHPVSSFSFSFTPEPRFRVLGTYPENGSEVGNFNTVATVIFNSNVTSQIIPLVSLSPSLTGLWRLSYDDSMRVEFYPDQANTWEFGKSYEVVVAAGAADVMNNALSAEYRSQFRFAPFRLSSSGEAANGRIHWLQSSVCFSSTGRIDPSTIASSVVISPAVSGQLNYITYYSYDGFCLWPELGFRGGKTYTITVDTTFRAVDGTSLAEPYVIRFSTSPFVVSSAYPANGSVVSPNSYCQVNFNANFTNLGSSLTITPSSYSGIYMGSNYFYFYPNAPNTEYTVTISAGLLSTAGDSLAVPYQFGFRTGS